MVGSNGYIAPEVLLKKGYGIECGTCNEKKQQIF